MTREPSVPVKTIILMILVLLSACTAVKIPREYREPQNRIVVAPIEIFNVDVPFVGWGMLFGVAGVLIEDRVTAPRRAAMSQNIREAWGDWRPEAVLRDKLAEELTKRGRNVIQEGEIVPLPEKIREQLNPRNENVEAARLWYDPDITVFDHSPVINRYSPTAIMETGYDNFYVGKGYSIFAILIKVVDPHTNNLIARKRAVARITMEKYELKDPIQLRQFVADFKTEFEKAVAKAAPKMLDDIGL